MRGLDTLVPYWLALAGGAFLAWHVMLASLYRQLKSRHPETYQALGSPILFIRSSTFAVLGFIYSARADTLQDLLISSLVHKMRWLFAAYLLFFLILLVLFLCFSAPSGPWLNQN